MPDQTQSPPAQSPQVRLGDLLREHRLAKKTEIPELARTLILSIAQITAIESGSQASFHNQTFYLRALKKYIALMDLGVDPQASLLFTEIESNLLSRSAKINPNEVNLLINAGLAHTRKSYLPQLQLKKSHFFWIVLTVLVLIGLAAALTEGWPEKQTNKQAELVLTPTTAIKTEVVPDRAVSQEQKAAPAAPTTTISSSTQPSDAKSSAESPADKKSVASTHAPETTSLKLTFSAPSWIQVVEQNGKRIEKVFTPQDSLTLDPATLATLVIGNARETKLFTNVTEVDLSKYLNSGSGVARLNQSEIMKLGQ